MPKAKTTPKAKKKTQPNKSPSKRRTRDLDAADARGGSDPDPFPRHGDLDQHGTVNSPDSRTRN